MDSTTTPPPPRKARTGLAIAGILASNALTLGIALWQHWSIFDLMWPFLIQSLIIGWFSSRRLLHAQPSGISELAINGTPVLPPKLAQYLMSGFFLVHYSLFHLGYVTFLLMLPKFLDMSTTTGQAPLNWWLYALLGVSFWFAHRASYRENLRNDLQYPRSSGSLMRIPYMRIIPMHLTLILGATRFGSSDPTVQIIVLFMALKTFADIGTHILEHRILHRPPKPHSDTPRPPA